MKNAAEVCRTSPRNFQLAGECFVFMHRHANSLQAPKNEYPDGLLFVKETYFSYDEFAMGRNS